MGKIILLLIVSALGKELYYPSTVEDIIEEAAIREGAPPELLKAICFAESSYNPGAYTYDDGSHRDSVGLCQVQLRTAKHMLCEATTENDLLDARVNARCAARYLRYQLKRYDYVWKYAAAAYNAGSLRKTQRGKILNRGYVKKVFARLGQ